MIKFMHARTAWPDGKRLLAKHVRRGCESGYDAEGGRMRRGGWPSLGRGNSAQRRRRHPGGAARLPPNRQAQSGAERSEVPCPGAIGAGGWRRQPAPWQGGA
jgi:hypothetical protein